jgi:hypothetical protein
VKAKRAYEVIVMQIRHIEQTFLTILFFGCCAAFGGACLAAGFGAETPPLRGKTWPQVLAQYTAPQSPEVPVSPTTPGTLPGTTAGSGGTSVGANPITGQPCLGGGSTAINGGIIGAPTTAGQPPEPGTNTIGLPPNNSVYGLNNGTTPGAC